VSILGGVFSHTPGFTTIGELLPGLGFHIVCMALGMFLLGKSFTPAAAKVQAAPAAKA
jgi:hypothetical protein